MTVIALIAISGFFIARSRSIKLATMAGGLSKLHSRPNYYALMSPFLQRFRHWFSYYCGKR
nr:phosphate ABC transporter permease family protein [Salinivibrio socompensis]